MTARGVVAVILSLSALTLAVAVAAADFPPLPASVSTAAARVNPALVSRLAELRADRAAMIASIADFDKACADVIKGTDADRRCAGYFPLLTAAKNKHVERCLIFIEDNRVAEASATALGPPVTSNGALSTAVEAAIGGAFRDAGAEVFERVRRGFQSVSASDPKAGAAWLRDALNHAPANLRLRDMVDVAEGPPPNTSGLKPPNESDLRFVLPGVPPSATPVAHVPGPDDVYYFQPGVGYSLMTRNGARVQQLLDVMSGAKPGSIIEKHQMAVGFRR